MWVHPLKYPNPSIIIRRIKQLSKSERKSLSIVWATMRCTINQLNIKIMKDRYEFYFPSEGKSVEALLNPMHGKQVTAMIMCQEKVDTCVVRHKTSYGKTEVEMVATIVDNDFVFLFPEKEKRSYD